MNHPVYMFDLSHPFLRRMRNVSDKSCSLNQNTGSIAFSLEEHTVYGIMWKNMVEPERPHMTI